MLLEELRRALGGLEVEVQSYCTTPVELMTEWLSRGYAAGDFELDRSGVLKSRGDTAATVRLSNQDLTAAEVAGHVMAGKAVTQLGLVWKERVRFVLTQDLTLKSIKFLDVVQSEIDDQYGDPESAAHASQGIMTAALTDLLSELTTEHLGIAPRA